MIDRNALARGKSASCLLLAFVLAATLQLALAAATHAEEAAATPSPSPSATPSPTPSPQPAATETPEPTRTPKPTATPTQTPLPAHDLAVAFFNNFCEAGQPLLATIFNTSATPLENQNVRLRLSNQTGALEEHDHQLSLAAYGTANLPLFNPAQPPWVKVEIELIGGAADPNPNNNSASCGVAATATPEAAVTEGPAPDGGDIEPGTSWRGAPPPASGGGSSYVWRQAAPTATPLPAPQPTVAPSTAPAGAQPIANGPQPSLTPIGDAGGGVAPAPRQPFPSRTLMMTGVVLLAAGTSWAFYYLTRPPKGA